jgi:hypothetical protein
MLYLRATALSVPHDFEVSAKGGVRYCPRNNWPETVGASLLAMLCLRATTLSVPHDFEVSAKGACASAPEIIGPKQM